jgi:sugar O-acyltransferase (sialic acid O-acetyltransferase NeuD family)
MIQIIGKGGFAREVASYSDGEYIMLENECEGLQSHAETIIAIGDGNVRNNVAEKFSHLSFSKFIASNVWMGKDCSIGAGAIICPGTILTVNISIGKHVIINLNCTIGHDCVIGDFVTVSPGANISGNVRVGNNCYIGTNAVIREKISICDNVVIGAGGVVVKNIVQPGIYVGNPVKKIG